WRSSGSPTPTTCRRTPAGFTRGPRTLKSVRTPSSRRTAATRRSAGWNAGAYRNARPTSPRQRAATPGSTSITTPSSSSTSALPTLPDTARLPCLATGTPARVQWRGGGPPPRRYDQRRSRRHVERPGAVAPRAAGVDRVRRGAGQRDRVRPQCPSRADQLLDALTLLAQPEKDRGDLRGR